MSRHFEREIGKLKDKILTVGAMVETAIAKSIASLTNMDANLAHAVIAADREIDQMEVDVEEECLKILALHQPVAANLRFVVAVLKINNDLERMGDLAANIAKRTIFLSEHPVSEFHFDFTDMALKAQKMVKQSLDVLVNADTELARRVCAADEELNELRSEVKKLVFDELKRQPDEAQALMDIYAVARHLERLGDMSTNVAEDVIYMVEGSIIRHRLTEARR